MVLSVQLPDTSLLRTSALTKMQHGRITLHILGNVSNHCLDVALCEEKRDRTNKTQLFLNEKSDLVTVLCENLNPVRGVCRACSAKRN